MSFMKKLLCVSSIALLMLGTSSCLVAVVGAAAGTYAWVNGEVRNDEPATLDACYNAAQRAVKNLGYTKISDSKDATYGEIKARNAKDQAIRIRLEKKTSKSTEVRIRVGTVGSKETSSMILNEMRKYL